MKSNLIIYARAAGPGALLGLLERSPVGIVEQAMLITVADERSGYRMLQLLCDEPESLCRYLSQSLQDDVLWVDLLNPNGLVYEIRCYSPLGGVPSIVVDRPNLPINSVPFLAKRHIRSAFRKHGLPCWFLDMPRCRRIPYVTIAVLDTRNLLVEQKFTVYEIDLTGSSSV